MKNKQLFIFMPVLLLFLFAVAFPCVAHADTAVKPISVKAILPENQKAGVSGYYDLLVKSGEKQTIYVQITNPKKKSITVDLVPSNAYTRPEGGIFYNTATNSQKTILLDQSFALSSYISVENEVVIKGSQSVNVPIEVTAPNMQIGSIIGGIMISEKDTSNESATASSKSSGTNFKVLTKTVYSIAIQLDFPNESTTDFSFGKAGFSAEGATAYIEMQNKAPMIQRQISGTYKVTNEGGEKLFEGKIPSLIMAPKTQINYSVPWNYTTLESGNYTLSVSANVAGKKINVDRDFVIDENAVTKFADKTNQPIAKFKIKPIYLIYLAIAVAMIILIRIVIWLIKNKHYRTNPDKHGDQPEFKSKPKHFKK